METRGIQTCRAGFTLVEAMVTVAAVGIIASVAVVATGNIREKVEYGKLSQDVRKLNTAIQLYEANGGTLGDTPHPLVAIMILKRRSVDAERDAKVGLTGRFMDPEATPVVMTIAEIASNQPRALWNNAKRKFEIATSGGSPFEAFKGFTVEENELEFLNDLNDLFLKQKEIRSADRLEYARSDDWVWDYEDTAALPLSAPTDVPLNFGGAPTTPGAPAGTSPLDPPGFSIAGGKYPLASYDKSLAFTNPNDASVSEILYSIVLGSWVVYDGTPVVVTPGVQVIAYARSTDPDNWTDSLQGVEKYATEPIPLVPAISVPAALSYAEAGGSMMPGGPAAMLASPGTITLANASAVPDEYENNGEFNVYWSYDGTDPLDPGDETIDGGGPPATIYGGDPFSGGFPGQAVDLLLPNWGAQSSLPIKVAARSFHPDVLTTSAVVTHTVGISTTSLRSSTLTETAGMVTLDLETTSGDMPVGARIYYTTDGTDPDNSGGNPVAGTEYTGPFSVKGLGMATVTVTARVYGPAGYPQWFNVSDATTSDIAVPPAAISFSHTASLSAP